MKLILILLLTLKYLTFSLYACAGGEEEDVSIPPEALIDRSKTILLVKVELNTKKMKIIEVLKGDMDLKDLYFGFKREGIVSGSGTFRDSGVSSDYERKVFDNDFSGHRDSDFWQSLYAGRGYYPCCLCGPMHIFKQDRMYLIFPDIWASMKAAELILSDEDKWYRYVKERVKKKTSKLKI